MTRTLGWVVAAAALVEFGWICGSIAGTAMAEEPPPAPEPTPPPAQHLLCKAFAAAADRPGVVDTSDRTTEIGQWVAEQAGRGWRVASVDFEVGTKPTGYPQPWSEVCLSR